VELPPFDRVVTEHGPVVLRVCRALVGASDADDAWSETFLSALRAYPGLRPDSDVRAWLLTIAHHRCIDLLRRRTRSAVPSEAIDPPPVRDAGGQGGALDEQLRAAVQALAPKQRAAVAYRYLADLSYAQIGELLGTNEAAARRSAADGIAALRARHLEGAPR
jgi:RNA polymerase sigma factor (sigma-70 family)